MSNHHEWTTTALKSLCAMLTIWPESPRDGLRVPCWSWGTMGTQCVLMSDKESMSYITEGEWRAAVSPDFMERDDVIALMGKTHAWPSDALRDGIHAPFGWFWRNPKAGTPYLSLPRWRQAVGGTPIGQPVTLRDVRDFIMRRREEEAKPERAYSKYRKDVSDLDEIDVYDVCELFSVNDPSGATQHAIKKLLLSGQRTGGKAASTDIAEAIDSLKRAQKIAADREA